MSRKIIIDKHKGNTHWSVHVIDIYGKEYHLGYINASNIDSLIVCNRSISEQAEEIWANEVKPKVDLMAEAIKECIEIDKENNIKPNLE